MSLIAFDLDGTLEDSRSDMVASVQRVRQELGLPNRPGLDFRPHVNRGMAHLYQVCFEEYLANKDPSAVAEVQALYVSDYSAHIAVETELYPGITDALGVLSQQASLAVVTNKPEALSRQLLAALGVDQFFKAVIGGDTCVTAKPTAAPLAEAARICGHSSVYMVGDSIGDIRCARAFGAVSIWCAWGYLDSTGEHQPDHQVGHPSELSALFQKLWAD